MTGAAASGAQAAVAGDWFESSPPPPPQRPCITESHRQLPCVVGGTQAPLCRRTATAWILGLASVGDALADEGDRRLGRRFTAAAAPAAAGRRVRGLPTLGREARTARARRRDPLLLFFYFGAGAFVCDAAGLSRVRAVLYWAESCF